MSESSFDLLTYCTYDPKMAAILHLGFLKIQIFNGKQSDEDHSVSLCQILWQSPSWIYLTHITAKPLQEFT